MSLDELRSDLKANLKAANQITDPVVRDYMKFTVWPFLESLVDEVKDIDGELENHLAETEEDYLLPETAGIFATVIQGGLELSAELRKTATPEMRMKLDAYDTLCSQAMQTLTEITMLPVDSEDEDEGGEGGEDEDEGEDGNA